MSAERQELASRVSPGAIIPRRPRYIGGRKAIVLQLDTNMLKLLKYVLAALVLTVVCSCKIQNDLTYMADLSGTPVGQLATARNDITIEPEDELMITVTAEIPAVVARYNRPAISSQSGVKTEVASGQTMQTYIVDRSGDIDFPVLGKIHVAGLTTSRLRDYLLKQIEKDVKAPVVSVRLVNFKVNVLGEVDEPKVVESKRERLTLFDALAACGDLTEYGRRDAVAVIRENPDGTSTYATLNLADSKITSSPYFVLKQNDVVYVAPNDIKQSNSKYNQNNGFKLSVISTVISGISVIASLVIALSVK